ncbi:ABC-three component system protein [uncultured Tyzzerella sp.]|uniref:ABC-three component system protein n=1 Tax=uncultured Tyzzerella sp. TaxID=2321398 RepID=UPI0029422DDA|nr:ABC-three component system protein [uncultured Tyzzerella sp.]
MKILLSEFNAIPSWEGYEYQAHISIYVTLENIYKFLKEKDNVTLEELKQKFKNMELEIEGLEDFSIKENNDYISIHQVKLNSLDLSTEDKATFIFNCLEYKIVQGYFHIRKGKKLPDGFLKETKIHIDHLIDQAKQSAKGNINIAGNLKKGSLEKFIRNFINENLHKNYTEENIECAKKKIIQKLEEIKKTLSDDNLEDSKYVQVYKELFDNSNEAIEKSCNLICEIITFIKNEDKYDYIEKDKFHQGLIYYEIVSKLKSYITNCYLKANTLNNKCVIPLIEIIDIIFEDYNKLFNNEYNQYYLFVKTILNLLDKYPKNPIKEHTKTPVCNAENCSLNDEKCKCNLKTQLKNIVTLDMDKKAFVIKNTLLQKPKDGCNNNLPEDNLINKLFLDILNGIDILKLQDDNTIKCQKNGNFYRLTLDNSDEIFEITDKILNFLQENEYFSFLYETDFLITNRLNGVFNPFESKNITKLSEKELKEIDKFSEQEKNITKPKVINLIDRENALKELRNETNYK